MKPCPRGGRFPFESLHHVHESIDFMSFMKINRALCANGQVVCVAVSVDLLMWMRLTMQHWGLHLPLQRLVHWHKLMSGSGSGLLVSSLAATAEVLSTLHTKWSGIFFFAIFTDFTLDFIRIHLRSWRTRSKSNQHRRCKQIHWQRWGRGRDSWSWSCSLFAFSASTFLNGNWNNSRNNCGNFKDSSTYRTLEGSLAYFINFNSREWIIDCNHQWKLNTKKSTVWNQLVKTPKTGRMQAW